MKCEKYNMKCGICGSKIQEGKKYCSYHKSKEGRDNIRRLKKGINEGKSYAEYLAVEDKKRLKR